MAGAHRSIGTYTYEKSADFQSSECHLSTRCCH